MEGKERGGVITFSGCGWTRGLNEGGGARKMQQAQGIQRM